MPFPLSSHPKYSVIELMNESEKIHSQEYDGLNQLILYKNKYYVNNYLITQLKVNLLNTLCSSTVIFSPLTLFLPSGWRCSARWSTRRSTTSSRPSRCCGGSAASSGSRSSSAVLDTPPSTDASAPAGTSAAARWRCAETVYNEARD